MTTDWRNIKYGCEIPKEGYCDQPYIVIAQDGGWVCTLTTAKGLEGDRDQHIISARSMDKGKTWQDITDIEPAGPPEASWVTPFITPYGRIYVFYTYNADQLSRVITDKGYEHEGSRVDTLGKLMFKYSDDNGKTWSAQRYQVPIRNFEIDEKNPYNGKVQFFWSVAKPYAHIDGAVYIGCSKVGGFGKGFMTSSEGVVLKSTNLLTMTDPEKITWETLPEGTVGLRPVKGPIADEHNVTGLSDASLYCTYRTIGGHNCHSYSRDGGKTWDAPAFAVYGPGQRKIKHNRAANFVRRYSNGKFTLWFHNHGLDWSDPSNNVDMRDAYVDRNPVWMCGGIEKDGCIHWSQPEIILYDDVPSTRISYPDFIEENGEYYISETQKDIARIHKIDRSLLEGMWNSFEAKTQAAPGYILETTQDVVSENLAFFDGNGFTVDFWIECTNLPANRIIFDARGTDGKGVLVETAGEGTIKITLTSRLARYSWRSDKHKLSVGLHHVGIVVDDGPKIITFLVDGQVLDGGDERQYGFGRYFCPLKRFEPNRTNAAAYVLGGAVKKLRVYSRYLRNYEVLANFQSKG